MKKLILTLTAIMMVGCDVVTKDKQNTTILVDYNRYSIVEIDSCEYIVSHLTSGGISLGSIVIHKGNCKYCQERMKKMIKEVKNDN